MASSLTSREYSPSELKEEFLKVYGAGDGVQVFSSPARINIIGEHIDYNGGKVFPAAIDRYLYVAIRKRADRKVVYNDMRFPGRFEFSVDDDFKFDRRNDYANYLNGILSQMKGMGFVFPCGFEVLMVSNIPAGGGISSSSALECGFAYAVSETFGFSISRVEIAKLGQMSEHKFMGVNCGIMDQFIIATGKKNFAEKLDCATLEYEYAPLELGDYRFVVMNTNKVRKLSDSKYNERRGECERALSLLNGAGVDVPSLCSLTPERWEEVKSAVSDSVLRKRAAHCVYENRRVEEAVSALKRNDLVRLGGLLNESHESLRSLYEVTGIELDTLADAARSEPGCLGARMTGAGFGGCAIALVHKDSIESFVEGVQAKYSSVVGYEAGFFACRSGDGVSRVEGV